MRKKTKELWTNLYIWSAICSLIGTATAVIVSALFSAMLYTFTEIIESMTVCVFVSLFTGSFAGGFMCGLFRRTNGLQEGFFCGFLMYIILLSVTFFLPLPLRLSIRKFLVCTLSASLGGVVGVNCKRPHF